MDYNFIRNDVTELTDGLPLYHTVLSAVANGDGQLQSTLKRANIARDTGLDILNKLCEIGIIKEEKSKQVFTSWKDKEEIPSRFLFTSPFLKFWFAFVSPLFKGIKEHNFQEVETKFLNKKDEYFQAQFLQLAYEILKKSFQDEDPVVEIGKYWNMKGVDIHIYAKTATGKIIVGSVKYTNSKMKKSELTRLEEQIRNTNIKPDIFVFISKEGFSKELKNLKSETIKFFTLKHLKILL